jgi:hypothetical protein
MTAVSQLNQDFFGQSFEPYVQSQPPVALVHLASSVDNGAVSFADAISAAGSSQATGTPLTATLNTVATVSAGQFVNLPPMVPGRDVTVQNTSGTLLLVAPAQGVTDTINGLAATAGMPVPDNSIATFYCTNAGTITCYGTNPEKSSFVANTASAAATLTAVSVAGNDTFNVINMTGSLSGGAALTLPTIAAVQAVLPFVNINSGFVLRIMNQSAGAFSWTLTNNGSFVTVGTSTIAQTTFRDFQVEFVNGTSAVATNMGGGNIV